MISAFVSLIICLLFGGVASARFTRPLSEMTEVANSVAQLDFSKKYAGSSDSNEISQLGQSINQMSDYLDHAITDLKNMNDQLETEIQQKQAIDDMRKEFIINISHELKTPIALIQGYAEGLRIGINESEEDKNYYCDIIIDEAHRMNRLVLQLLNLSKIELGNTVPVYSEVDLYDLAETVVSKTRVMWQEKQLRLDLSGIGDEVVCADYDMLEQAVTNYLTNAIDHTPVGGVITMTSETDQMHYIFRVRNQGSQLAVEEMEKIWDKFYKLDKARTRVSGGGSGIGLSIVRAIMIAHHGGCGVNNVEDGVEFYLSLPKDVPESH
jgi:signal transduction histidine kinase